MSHWDITLPSLTMYVSATIWGLNLTLKFGEEEKLIRSSPEWMEHYPSQWRMRVWIPLEKEKKESNEKQIAISMYIQQ